MPTRWTRYLMLTLAVTLAVSATTTVVTAAPSAAASTTTITLVTHDSFAVVEARAARRSKTRPAST